jgi:hypothetical protein
VRGHRTGVHRGDVCRYILSAVMPRWASALPLCLAVAALVAGRASSVDTGGLTKVEISSYQALSPPFGSAQAMLT